MVLALRCTIFEKFSVVRNHHGPRATVASITFHNPPKRLHVENIQFEIFYFDSIFALLREISKLTVSDAGKGVGCDWREKSC